MLRVFVDRRRTGAVVIETLLSVRNCEGSRRSEEEGEETNGFE